MDATACPMVVDPERDVARGQWQGQMGYSEGEDDLDAAPCGMARVKVLLIMPGPQFPS